MPDKVAKLVTNKLLYAGLIIVGCVVLALWIFNPADKEQRTQIKLGNSTYTLEIADDESSRVQGLSGRDDLSKNSAMLFVFPDSDKQCMWMKDMKFSLDMIWLDSSKKITKVAEDVSPNTYPQTFCADNTKYVLEFNTGAVRDNKVKVGQNLNF